MYRQRWIGVLGVLFIAAGARAQSTLETDELILKSQNPPVQSDAKSLIAFFDNWTLKPGEEKAMEALVKKLGSDIYREREPAAKELIGKGPRALPFLRSVLPTAPLEMKRRAESCIRDIEATMKPDVIAAAARVLAVRKDPKAAAVLFNFLPSISSDAFLEEEILAAVGRLTITADKVDPLLLDALNEPQAFRKLAAAYLIGRRAGPEHRAKLRDLLDGDPRVRERVMQGLYGKRAAQALQEAQAADETTLKGKVESNEAALLQFFKKRTLSEDDQKRLRSLVKDLGHSAYKVREEATRKILAEGPPALSFLKEAEYDGHVELSRRARDCLDKIRTQNTSAVPIAAAHLLAKPPQQGASPAASIRTLLTYAPFVDDEHVEEEILTCLTLLSVRETKVEPALIKALSDVSPARRAAAAYVLGHVGTKDEISKVQALLDDVNPIVRLRAAQGMMAARDKVALPTFVSLLNTAPAPYLPKVEQALHLLGDEKAPSETILAGSPDSRAKAAKAWDKYLKDNDAKIDLTSLNDRESYLGLVTVCEYDNQVGQINGQVWEGTRGGAKRYSFTGVQAAMDAQTLPNGRVLVAENSMRRVSERDNTGKLLWDFTLPFNPICCQRLPNGNTFIASYNMVMEVTPNKTEVYRAAPGPQFYIFCAYKAKNGHIVAITANNQVIEFEPPPAGQNNVKILNTVQVNTQGNWCSVELMPNGNYLVASMSTNSVKEIDRKGTEVWSKQFNGAFRATRLPTGNVLVASMTTRQVAEIDRGGTVRWQINTTGRPWAVHYR